MWGAWWVWDARLTSELILFFLYLGYIALTSAIEDTRRAERAGALIAIVGAINVPIIYYSVEWWNSLHQAPSVIGAEGMGQLFCRLGRAQAAAWIGGKRVISHEISVKPPPRGKHACDRPAVEPTCMQLRDKSAQLMRVQLIERRIAGLACKLDQRFNVTAISRRSVRGQSPLVGEDVIQRTLYRRKRGNVHIPVLIEIVD